MPFLRSSRARTASSVATLPGSGIATTIRLEPFSEPAMRPPTERSAALTWPTFADEARRTSSSMRAMRTPRVVETSLSEWRASWSTSRTAASALAPGRPPSRRPGDWRSVAVKRRVRPPPVTLPRMRRPVIVALMVTCRFTQVSRAVTEARARRVRTRAARELQPSTATATGRAYTLTERPARAFPRLTSSGPLTTKRPGSEGLAIAGAGAAATTRARAIVKASAPRTV